MNTQRRARMVGMILGAGVICMARLGAFARGSTPPARAVAARSEAREAERDKDVKYERLPGDVRRALANERGDHEVKQVHLVHRGGRTFYRAIIDTKGEDKVVRLDEHGRVISEQEVNDRIEASREARERDRHRDVPDKVPGERETQVKYENIPADVRRTLDRQRGQHQVKEIMRVNHGGDDEFYRAIIVDKGGVERVVRIAPGGKLKEAEQVRAK